MRKDFCKIYKQFGHAPSNRFTNHALDALRPETVNTAVTGQESKQVYMWWRIINFRLLPNLTAAVSLQSYVYNIKYEARPQNSFSFLMFLTSIHTLQ
jgi:hypothetical protein